MNRTFIKVLPLAAAVLLATSCSKEDNNNEIVNNGQEKVEKQFKTITVKGNAGKKQGISKISLDEGTGAISFISLDEGTGAISFEENDDISFSGNGVSGTGKFIDGAGNFIADLTFTEDAEVTDVAISATIGTALTGAVACESWSEIANYLYETSSATSTLKETSAGVYEFKSPFEMVPQIAILKNISGTEASYSIGEVTNQTLAAGSILVVMSGTTLTINGKTATVSAGNSYNIAATPAAPTVTGKFTATTQGTVNYTVTSNHEGTLQYNNGADWVNVSNNVIEGLTPGSSLSFRTAKTSTSYASEATSAETVPTISTISPNFVPNSGVPVVGNALEFPYCSGNTWADVAGVDENGRFTEGNNTYQIFDDDNPVSGTDVIDNTKTYTYKQVLTVTITVSDSESFNLTYYAGDTWEILAERGSYNEITVDNATVYCNDQIICYENYATVDAYDEIDSNKRYRLQSAD
jgi:hypothetical protein